MSGQVASGPEGPALCWAGHYRRDYPRSVSLQAGARRAGFEVIDAWGPSGLATALRTLRICRQGRCRAVVVGYPGYRTLPLVSLAARINRLPVVFDAFVGLHETRVVERAEVPRGSVRAAVLRMAELLAWRMSDVVVMDTLQHAAWVAGQGAKRVASVVLGPDLERMVPCDSPGEPDLIVGYGNFAPLHGAPVIADAARNLRARVPSARVVLAGDGPELGLTRSRSSGTGLELVGRKSPSDLRTLLCSGRVCLGIFGTSEKAGRVIPNKVLDALALGRPVVTRDGPAARELLGGAAEAVLLVPPGDPVALADALAEVLARPPDDLARIGASARQLVEERFGPTAIAGQLRAVLSQIGVAT